MKTKSTQKANRLTDSDKNNLGGTEIRWAISKNFLPFMFFVMVLLNSCTTLLMLLILLLLFLGSCQFSRGGFEVPRLWRIWTPGKKKKERKKKNRFQKPTPHSPTQLNSYSYPHNLLLFHFYNHITGNTCRGRIKYQT